MANRRTWQRGDLVIHDRDTKEHRMIRVVVAVLDDGRARTVFQFRNELPEAWRKRVFLDRPEHLHDPRRFGLCRAGRTDAAKAGAESGAGAKKRCAA